MPFLIVEESPEEVETEIKVKLPVRLKTKRFLQNEGDGYGIDRHLWLHRKICGCKNCYRTSRDNEKNPCIEDNENLVDSLLKVIDDTNEPQITSSGGLPESFALDVEFGLEMPSLDDIDLFLPLPKVSESQSISQASEVSSTSTLEEVSETPSFILEAIKQTSGTGEFTKIELSSMLLFAIKQFRLTNPSPYSKIKGAMGSSRSRLSIRRKIEKIVLKDFDLPNGLLYSEETRKNCVYSLRKRFFAVLKKLEMSGEEKENTFASKLVQYCIETEMFD